MARRCPGGPARLVSRTGRRCGGIVDVLDRRTRSPVGGCPHVGPPGARHAVLPPLPRRSRVLSGTARSSTSATAGTTLGASIPSSPSVTGVRTPGSTGRAPTGDRQGHRSGRRGARHQCGRPSRQRCRPGLRRRFSEATFSALRSSSPASRKCTSARPAWCRAPSSSQTRRSDAGTSRTSQWTVDPGGYELVVAAGRRRPRDRDGHDPERMTEIRRLVTRMDLDQKIGQIQGVVPMDLVDFAKLDVHARAVPDCRRDSRTSSTAFPLVRPHGVGHLSLRVAARPGPRTASEHTRPVPGDRTRTESVRYRRRSSTPRASTGSCTRRATSSRPPWGQAASWDPDVPRHGRRDRGAAGPVGRYPLVLVAAARSRARHALGSRARVLR